MNLLRTIMHRCPSINNDKFFELFKMLFDIFSNSTVRLADSIKSNAFLLLAELAKKFNKCQMIIET